MARNEVLAVPLELQRLAVILADQVADPRLRKPYSNAQLRAELPLQLLGCRVDVVERRRGWFDRVAWGAIGFGVWGELRMEEGGCGGVDGASEQHEAFSEDVSCEAQDSVSIHASMLEVDACCTIRSDDNLQLSHPSISAHMETT